MAETSLTRDQLLEDLVTALSKENPGPEWFTWGKITERALQRDPDLNLNTLRDDLNRLVRDGKVERKKYRGYPGYHYRYCDG